MSRHLQVAFDAPDQRSLSSYWLDVLGYVHPAPSRERLTAGSRSVGY
ncbi:MAG TPA: hypothetical protein VFN61_07525 [Acidimicrobiales bacterium]|nr:hypothetical protein [Acidimicrobiales bacterium]